MHEFFPLAVVLIGYTVLGRLPTILTLALFIAIIADAL